MSEETPPMPLRLLIHHDIPSLLTSLFTFPASSKFDHVFASCTLAAVWGLAHLTDTKRAQTKREHATHVNVR